MRLLLLFLCSIFFCSAKAQTNGENQSYANTTNTSILLKNRNDTDNERIINFHADIAVQQSGLIKVTEHIKVYSKTQRILHGIVRSIPLYRKDIFGSKKIMTLLVTQVRKNGKDSPYTLKDESNSRKIYIGKQDEAVEQGIIDYDISYESNGQVGFFSDYDEIYWNVTGNTWDFDIEQASVKITFPNGASPGNASCYTGKPGSKSQECSSEQLADHSIIFHTKGVLKPGEGFTVASAFTKGIIKRPGLFSQLFTDYLMITLGTIMVLIFAVLYFYLWKKYGKDPVKSVIIPSFQIPMGWSPALLRFFHKKEYDEKALAAAMVNLAVNKTIKITDKGSIIYQFEKLNGKQQTLAAEEKILLNTLFKSKDSITTERANGATFSKARKQFEKQIEGQLKISNYYQENYKPAIYTGFGTVLILAIYLCLISGSYSAFRLPLMVPLFVVGIYLIKKCIQMFRNSAGIAILLCIAAVPFIVVPIGTAYLLVRELPLAALIILVITAVMYAILLATIKTYTKEGLEIKTAIEGFKLYLKTAEEHRLNLLNPPEHTQSVFERFLPYAIALDLENAWAQKFNDVLEHARQNMEWYSSDDVPYGQFVTAIPLSFYNSLKVTDPSASSSGSSNSSSSDSSGSSSWSSGSSDSGSSGGGGGGGGGGGW